MSRSTWEAYEGKPAAVLEPLVLRSARLLDPASIPPRQWLYGTQLVRGFVTVMVAPGGTGKTAYAMVVAAALASGIRLLNEHVFERVNVAVLNLEDPMDELDRRLAGIRLRYKLGPDDLQDRYFMHSGEDRPLVMAKPSPDGFEVIYPDEEILTKEIMDHDIGLIVVDPFAESHSLEENSNPQMVKASAAWRRIARATSCAILLVHHVRKGAVSDIDSARGAKALTDSARIGLLLATMSEDDAENLGVNAEERTRYIRLDDAKANMAPRAAAARWFKLDQIELHNGRGNYPNGDKVAVIEAWEAPTPFSRLSSIDCNAVLDLIAEGIEPGVLFTLTKRGGSQRWCGQVLIDQYSLSEKQAGAVIATWIKNGLLYEAEFTNPNTRQKKPGAFVNHTKRPS
jgi:hypothetical protein